MLSVNNILAPKDGSPITTPTQDMILGSYYLTHPGLEDDRGKDDTKGDGKIFSDMNEMLMAYQNGTVGIHARVKVRRYNGSEDKRGKLVESTVGRFIFNQSIPQDLGFVDRSDPEKMLDLEVDFTTAKSELGKIVDRTIKLHGPTVMAEVLDAIKSNGFKYSTKASISISVLDMVVPPQKQEIVHDAEKKVEKIAKDFRRGLLSDDERYRGVISVWDKATKDVTEALQKGLDRYNPIKMMSDSGARGSISQMKQLAGMRGLMVSTSGKTMELPIKSNFREGLNVLEYFIGARGSRKTLSDTALKTADSGYLTRRLVDVSQEVIVREKDCGTTEGIWVYDLVDGDETIEKLEERLPGRTLVEDVVDPANGEVIASAGELLTAAQASKIVAAGVEKVHVRSILKCKCRHGICAKCYGTDLATGKLVAAGEAVGIIAAQSIGEPGTQLTMRTFHLGGIAGADITQGLPRVEEIFEARKPKKTATLAEYSGIVRIQDAKRARNVIITSENGEEHVYPVPYGTKILPSEGSYIMRGELITEGNLAPADIARVQGLEAAYDYITREVQRVYKSQDIKINDKHIEVIARQMTRKVRVEDSGDTELLFGSVVDIDEFNDENKRVQARIDAGERTLRLAAATPMLLGITKTAIQTESFLSAASFQETTKVLTEAAIKGKVDHLIGLKENVLIGKLIPAGTGLKKYRDIEIKKVEPSDEEYSDEASV